MDVENQAPETGLTAPRALPVERRRQLIGEYLLEKGLISENALNSALKEQKVSGKRIGSILVRCGFLAYKDLVDAIIHLDPTRIATERVVRSRMPAEILDEYSIILTAETEDEIFVSTMRDEKTVREIVTRYYPEKKIKFVSFVPDNMGEFIAKARTANIQNDQNNEDDVLEQLLFQAISEGASDLHIEPKYESYSVFFRHLGVRRHMYEGKSSEYQVMAAQIKDRARMDLAERRQPQDGGFQVEHAGKLIDLRVATIPAVEGEKIVIRVLDPDRVQPKLEALGITRIDEWRKGFDQMHGLCLVCGPTGSGKTTTLNATIRELDRFGKAIYTVEDPVEYKISYTAQVPVNDQVGVDFARAIRAFMRADPDIIVLGEIRDEETARNAIRAADTGHLVLATLHTGDIIGSISRLRDLDIQERQLVYLLRSVLVQTLVRAVCQHCHGTKVDPVSLKPCRVCHATGYSHRTAVSECVSFSESDDWLRVLEGKRSWPTKLDDAMMKFDKGIVDEVSLRQVFGSSIDSWREARARNPGKELPPG